MRRRRDQDVHGFEHPGELASPLPGAYPNLIEFRGGDRRAEAQSCVGQRAEVGGPLGEACPVGRQGFGVSHGERIMGRCSSHRQVDVDDRMSPAPELRKGSPDCRLDFRITSVEEESTGHTDCQLFRRRQRRGRPRQDRMRVARVVPGEGLEQSGDLPGGAGLYRRHGIDSDSVVRAALDMVD